MEQSAVDAVPGAVYWYRLLL